MARQGALSSGGLARCYPETAPTSTLPPAAGPGYEAGMTARVRKFIGLFGILAFLAAYIFVVSLLADHVPKAWELAFYVVAGLGWGLPIFPLISWMNRGR
jgi:hypothetical protein